MHRCSSSSQGNMMGPCSCGLFQCQCNSSSWLFSMPNHRSCDETGMYPFMSSSSSSVDCTLSLGTPSTRLCEDDEDNGRHVRNNDRNSSFGWDLLQNGNAPYNDNSQYRTAKASGRGGGNSSSGNDSLLARRCANCDTTSTPLWRNGPRGPKSLCNACGIRFKKEERRATAANANSNSSSSTMEQQQQYHHHGYDYDQYQQQNNSWVNSWVNHHEFRFIEDNDQDSDTGSIPNYLSWRLNLADRPTSLVHDFTR